MEFKQANIIISIDEASVVDNEDARVFIDGVLCVINAVLMHKLFRVGAQMMGSMLMAILVGTSETKGNKTKGEGWNTGDTA